MKWLIYKRAMVVLVLLLFLEYCHHFHLISIGQMSTHLFFHWSDVSSSHFPLVRCQIISFSIGQISASFSIGQISATLMLFMFVHCGQQKLQQTKFCVLLYHSTETGEYNDRVPDFYVTSNNISII